MQNGSDCSNGTTSSGGENEAASISSVDHFEEINRILDIYENIAKQENHYLLCTSFPLGRFNIQTGISPARTFSPSIMLHEHAQPWKKMTFGSYEWTSFNEMLQQRLVDFFEASEDHQYGSVTDKCGDFITVIQTICANSKFLRVVKLGTSIDLHKEDVCEILHVENNLISHRITTLERLDFSVYYHNLLRIVKDWLHKSSYLTGFDILQGICDASGGSFLSSALREYMYYYKNDVIEELNK